MIFFLLSVLLGVVTNYSQELSQFARPIILKFNHNLFGLLGYIIGIISLCYAYYTKWFIFYTSEGSRIVALVATILGTLWTMYPAIVSGYHQIKTFLKR